MHRRHLDSRSEQTRPTSLRQQVRGSQRRQAGANAKELTFLGQLTVLLTPSR